MTAESSQWRNLIPPEPWLSSVASNAGAIAEWVGSRLEAGAYNSVSAVASARKGAQGTRPVPIVGVGERIAYRAIASYVLGEMPPVARDAEVYRQFVSGPIDYAFGDATGPMRLGDARISYVVEADITAFYQYVDHEVLRRELELQTGRVEGVEYLTQILGDIQGASYGLPQLLDSSDALSEMYVRIMERDVVRSGLVTWRYNDDFRVGAASYASGQDSIERLADAARKIGLVLNEHKTYITRFFNYMGRYVDVQVDDASIEIDPDDVEVAVADYVGLEDDEAASAALGTLARLDLSAGSPKRIDLKRLSSDDLRELRRAVNSLRRLANPGALSRLVHLYLFAPSLTPRLTEYLISLHATHGEEVERIWDSLSTDHAEALGEWQFTWLIYAARTLSLLIGRPDRASRVKVQRLRGTGGLLHAEASLALAQVSALSFDELDIALRSEPEPLAPWHVLGIKALTASEGLDQQRLKAVKDTSPLYRILIDT